MLGASCCRGAGAVVPSFFGAGNSTGSRARFPHHVHTPRETSHRFLLPVPSTTLLFSGDPHHAHTHLGPQSPKPDLSNSSCPRHDSWSTTDLLPLRLPPPNLQIGLASTFAIPSYPSRRILLRPLFFVFPTLVPAQSFTQVCRERVFLSWTSKQASRRPPHLDHASH